MCEFCNTIYTEDEMLKKFKSLVKDDYSINTGYFLGKNSIDRVGLYCLSIKDNGSCFIRDNLPVYYCPMCGRKLPLTDMWKQLE